MIALEDVTMFHPKSRKRTLLLDNVTVNFGAGEHVGILAAQGTGRSTIARLLSGIEDPDHGMVKRHGSTSWPLGFAGFLHPFVSVADNLKYLAELIGLPAVELIGFCHEFIGPEFVPFKKVQDLAPAERLALAYACSIAKHWDCYVVDETVSVGDKEMREKCDAILAQRTQSAGIVILSRSVPTLKSHADRYYVLLGQSLRPCTDLDAAADALTMHRTDQAGQSEVARFSRTK